MTTITNETIAKLENKGFNRWTKGNIDRLYINARDYGVEYTRYANGKVSGGEFAGEQFGAYEARNFEATKVYIDVTTGELNIQTRTDFEDEIRAAVEAIIAECTAEPEPEVTETDADYLIYARENFVRENFRAAVAAKLEEVIESGKSGGASEEQLNQARAAAERILSAIDTEHDLAWWGSNTPSVTDWIRTH